MSSHGTLDCSSNMDSVPLTIYDLWSEGRGVGRGGGGGGVGHQLVNGRVVTPVNLGSCTICDTICKSNKKANR